VSATLNIIGCGKLARTLARLWADKRVLSVGDILNRSPGSAAQAVSFIGEGRAVAAMADMRFADLWMIATPDDQIRAACESLAAAGRFKAGAIVFHCSGALGSPELAAAANLGASVASAHPVASFSEPASMLMKFSGTYCCIEGDTIARETLGAVFGAIGARVLKIDGASKIIYHAGAVFASNYLVALVEVAVQACIESGIPRVVALELLQPLVQGSVESVFRLGTAKALTGPIARGDLDLVKKQHAALAAWDPSVAALYKELGLVAARLARRTVEF
jgi:predicted short-subunit dehydrogenase-like oxidoreductase (DUF2520 family)